MSQSVIQAVFLAIPPSVAGGTEWMNYTLCVCPFVGAIVLLLFRIDYKRLKMDLKDEATAEEQALIQ